MKLKTRKSVAKRLKISGTKSNRWGKGSKLIRKSAGQNHFNARDTGSTTIKKRRTHGIASTDRRNALRQIPYA